jgi:trigger factor
MNHEKAEAEKKPVSKADDPGILPPTPTAPEENPLIRRFQISMSKEDIARETERLAEQYSQKMKMPGFRQGKVPVDVVKKVHKQALREEVIQQAVSKLAFARIEKDKIAIAGEPTVEKMDDRDGEDFQADIAVETLPAVDLPDLESLRVEIPGAALKGEAFDEARQVDMVLEANKKSLPVTDRAIAEGDLVLLLVQSTDHGSKRKWPRQESYFMMNKENQSEIAGLYDELLGKKSGETFAMERTYPADAAKKAWAGKKIAHQAEIKAVYELKKPELDEDFLKSMGMKSSEEFKRKLKEEYQHHQEHEKDEKVMDGIYEKLLEASRFPVPRSLQEQEVARRLTQNRQPLNFKNDEEKNKFKEMLFAQAEKAVRLSLILEQVREQHHIAVNDQDLEKEYAHLARHHSVPEKEIRKYYSEEKKAAELKDHLLNVKINEFIKEKIKIKEV